MLTDAFDALSYAEKTDPINIGKLQQDIDDVNIQWEDFLTQKLLPDALNGLAQFKTTFFHNLFKIEMIQIHIMEIMIILMRMT